MKPTLRLRQAFATWLCLGLFVAASAVATAQGRPPDTPGEFDFYVLSLSWSPTFCEGSGSRRGGLQCGVRPYSFVVHGLWPQFDRGFPRSCQVPAPRLPRRLVTNMLDLMPARKLIYHEWDEHGTCSGLAPESYFETVRKARAKVKTPTRFADLETPLIVAPSEVKAAFIESNPGLHDSGVVVECDNRLREVRICLSKDLQFRPCPQLARRSCSRGTIVMPPVRGGLPE